MTDVIDFAVLLDGPPMVVRQPDMPPEYVAVLQLLHHRDVGTGAVLYVAADTDQAGLDRAIEWAESRIGRFVEHGAEPDGWGEHEVGEIRVLQLCAREEYLPELVLGS
ncbi:MAG TPA: hypothetical protein VFC00_24375 [Micromonosporaceae bacterium]|nr:hypothetical protein [Micromonosporaceae bacterium]